MLGGSCQLFIPNADRKIKKQEIRELEEKLKDEIEYNYGGYVSRQDRKKKVVSTSFFNSSSREDHSNDSVSSALLR